LNIASLYMPVQGKTKNKKMALNLSYNRKQIAFEAMNIIFSTS